MIEPPINPATGRRLEGCAFGPCLASSSRGGAGCHLCDVIAKLPQPARRGGLVAATEDPADVKPQANPARDGDPKLAGAKERRHPMYEKRRRQGPHRSNA